MIVLKNLYGGYDKTPVLQDISLAIPRGSFFTLAGPNGSGKSTLLKTIGGLLTPTEGEIYVNQKPLEEYTPKELAKLLTYLPQGKTTPQMTVEQLVLHGRFPYMGYPRGYTKEDREITQNALETLGLTPYAHQSLATLSGGMRQKVYLAMALCTQSECLLLDEPTTYLDIAHQIALMELLEELCKQGKTVVAVLHDLPLAFSYSHQVGIVKKGQLVGVGTPEELCQGDTLKNTFGVTLGCTENNRYYYK